MSEHPNCPFCIKPDAVIENERAFARYDGDIENPRGGVRGVIPDKQKYEKRIILYKESPPLLINFTSR